MRKLLLISALLATPAMAQEDGPGPNLVIEVAGEASGTVVIDMFEDVAPAHVEQITTLAEEGAYDNVVFHRVIDGFMAQTGDPTGTGGGGSSYPNLRAEFSLQPYERGVVGMARTSDPHSANSQFFIMYARNSGLNGKYTVWGQVVSGMEHIDKLRKGVPGSGMVRNPDIMKSLRVAADVK